jgi:hypothetical protein
MKRGLLQKQHGITSKKTAFLQVVNGLYISFLEHYAVEVYLGEEVWMYILWIMALVGWNL